MPLPVIAMQTDDHPTAPGGRLCHSRTTLTAIRRERGAEGFAALRRALLWAAAH